MARLVDQRQPPEADSASTGTPTQMTLEGPHAKWLSRLPGAGLRKGVAALLVLSVTLVAAIVAASAVGTVPISPLHTAAILLNATHLVHITPTWPESEATILLIIRVPRVLGAALVGAALGVSGTLFQGLLRNPLADPLLLGTSAGAALGATIAFLLPTAITMQWAGFGLVEILAFLGALLAVALVYRLATRRGQTPVVTLLLAGVAVSAVLTAVQTLLISINDRLGLRLTALYLWITGGVTVQSWTQVAVVCLLVVVGIIGGLAAAPALDAFAVGEEMAAHVGLRVERAKLGIVALAALLVAAAVSISGLVGFVGLIAPHLCRLTLGPRHRLLIPAAGLAGAVFVVLADLGARTLASPTELPLGVVTALVGGPFFLWLLRFAGDRYHW